MYDISVFPKRNGDGLIREAEIAFFDDDFLESMIPLIDAQVGLSLRDFFKRFRELPKVDNPQSKVIESRVKLMEEVLGDRVRMVTVPYDLKANDVWPKLNERFSRMRELSEAEREDSLTDIDYILSNLNVLVDTIPPRSREDYDAFLKQCERIERMRDGFLEMQGRGLRSWNKTEDFVAYIKGSALFYKPREKPVATGARLYMKQVTMFRRFKHGLRFAQNARTEKIPAGAFRQIKL